VGRVSRRSTRTMSQNRSQCMTAGTRKRKSGEGSSKRRGKRSVVVPEKKYEFESHSKLDNLYRCYQFLACARTEELEGLQTHMEMYSKVFFGDMASQVGQGLCADEQRRALLVNTLERFPVFELFERNNPDFVIYRYEPGAVCVGASEDGGGDVPPEQPVKRRRGRAAGFVPVGHAVFDSALFMEMLHMLHDKTAQTLQRACACIDLNSSAAGDREVIERYETYTARYHEIMRIYEALLIVYYDYNFGHVDIPGHPDRSLEPGACSWVFADKYMAGLRKWLEMFAPSVVLQDNMFEIVSYILAYISVEIACNCDGMAGAIRRACTHWIEYGRAHGRGPPMDYVCETAFSVLRAECPFLQQADKNILDMEKSGLGDAATNAAVTNLYYTMFDNHMRMFSIYKKITDRSGGKAADGGGAPDNDDSRAFEREDSKTAERGVRKRKRGTAKTLSFQQQTLSGNTVSVVQVTTRSISAVGF
jgi:hypothetical protein